MADAIHVVDGPMAGRVVRGPGIILYRFPIPEGFKTASIAASVSATDLPRFRYWLYRLDYLRNGETVYRYVGIEENGYPKNSIMYAMRELSEGLQELERILKKNLLNMFPPFVTGRNVGPDYGLPEDCGGLGLSSGSSLDSEDTSLRVGWRWWLVKDGKLTGVVYKTEWPTKGPIQAFHMPVEKTPVDHPLFAPSGTCQCGVYARETPSGIHQSSLGVSHYALGITVGWGKVVQHTSGWRSQFARPLCVVRPKRKDPVLELVAKSYGVPFVTLSQAYKMGGEFAA